MALILAVEPDEQQAAILSGVVMNQLRADLILVDSKDAAIARIGRQVPDLVLLTALLSPRDEEEILERLRKMEDADHLQTLTIPQLGAEEEQEARAGLLRAFRRKRAVARPRGCDPGHFGREIRSYLKRAQEIKAERRAVLDAALAAAAESEVTVAPVAEAVEPVPVDPIVVTAPLVGDARPVEPRLSAAPRHERIDRSSIVHPLFTTPEAVLSADLARAIQAIDAGDSETDDELALMIGALRIPRRVAVFEYPRGCRIERIRVAAAPFSGDAAKPVSRPLVAAPDPLTAAL
jgi:hypothetical protein